MYKTFLHIVLLCIPLVITAQQNLVPNPSFEDTVRCPWGTNDPGAVALWFNPTNASPDYYNACAQNGGGVPWNDWGYQYAHTGNAYIGIITHPNDSQIINYREYMAVELTQKLKAGQVYYWCMWVSLLDSAESYSNNTGISLSKQFVTDYTIETVLGLTAYGYHEQIITDYINWVQIGGQFTAQGGERYLYIGNFLDDNNTDVIQWQQNERGGSAAYYYIDDVYIGETPCMHYTYNIPNVITPNGDGLNDVFQLNFPYERVVVYNRWGQQVFESDTNAFWDGKTLNGKEAPTGTYYYIIVTNEETYKGFVQVLR